MKFGILVLFSGLSIAPLFGWVSQSSFADDLAAKASLAKAKAHFSQRSSASTQAVDDALVDLVAAESQAQSTETKYDVLVFEARAYYFKGTHTAGDSSKKSIHNLGQAKADAADALTSDYADAPYWAAVNLARWGEANGIVASLAQVPTLKKYLAKAMDRSTREGQDGESIDGFGPHRTLGRMLKKLPGLFGGSHSESVKELDKAVKGDPTTALNVVYLADSLLKDGNGSEQAEGRNLLNALLAKDANSLNRDRVVESVEEFALARQVLAGKEIQ